MPRVTVVPAPAIVMPPMVLLEIAMTPGVPVPAKIPVNCALAPAPVQVMLPVAAELPIVLPVVVPMFIDPATAEMPALIVDVEDVEMLMFRIVLFCRLDGVVVPADIRMPINV